jgi:HSP20 family protein
MENDKEYKVELAAPGTSKDDFDVQLNENGDLHVKLETKTDKRD